MDKAAALCQPTTIKDKLLTCNWAQIVQKEGEKVLHIQIVTEHESENII